MANEDDSSERVGWLFHAISKKDLKPGDHIYCYRMIFLYRHHGIYVGRKDCEVIHFSGTQNKDKSEAQVRKCTLQEFCDGDQLCLVAYSYSCLLSAFKRGDACHVFKCDTSESVIERAQHYLNRPDLWGEYHLLFNNCETFAIYCKTEKKYSSQGVGPIQALLNLRAKTE